MQILQNGEQYVTNQSMSGVLFSMYVSKEVGRYLDGILNPRTGLEVLYV